jgi:hypothetical protein
MNMDYDWQKIFQDKTDEELYQIYIGHSQLPDDTIKFAKDELDIRNFEFDKMDRNRLSWQLPKLIDEEQYSERQTQFGKRIFLSFKTYLLILLGVFIITFFLFWGLEPLKHMAIFSMVSVFMTIITLSNNYIHIRMVIKQSKRIEEINRLKNELREQSQIIDEYPRIEDLKQRKDIEFDVRKKLILAGIFFLIISLLLMNQLKA